MSKNPSAPGTNLGVENVTLDGSTITAGVRIYIPNGAYGNVSSDTKHDILRETKPGGVLILGHPDESLAVSLL